MIPSPLPAVQKLFSWSMMQPWVMFGTVFQSPKLFTTLPSGSNSMYGGACCAISASLSVMSLRLTMKTGSCASTHTPLTCPITHFSGRGFGQLGSTTNFAPPACACARELTPRATTKPMPSQILAKRVIPFFIFPPVKPNLRRVQLSASFARDSRDLDVSTQRQLGDLHSRSRRKGILEVLFVDGVHFLELRQIDQIDLNRSDIGVLHVRVVENVSDVFQTNPGLLAEVVRQCMGLRVRSLQTGDIQSVPSQDSRTVGRVLGDEFRAYRSVPRFRRCRKEQEANRKRASNEFGHVSIPPFLES